MKRTADRAKAAAEKEGKESAPGIFLSNVDFDLCLPAGGPPQPPPPPPDESFRLPSVFDGGGGKSIFVSWFWRVNFFFKRWR